MVNDDNKTLTDSGRNAKKITKSGSSMPHRMELNPYGTSTTGCVANGTITKKS